MQSRIRASAFGASLACFLGSTAATANPRPLPFSYPYETLPEGDVEIEQYVDMTPIRASTDAGRVWLNTFLMQTEFEYGISDRLELGVYVQYAPVPGEGYLQVPVFAGGGNGIKQRLRLRLAEADEWPVDVSIYGEVTELASEIELEAKINLQKRIGAARVMVNLWAEREFYLDGRKEWVLHPTAGVTYEVTPSIHPGIEYWMLAEFPDDAPTVKTFAQGPHHFVGPAVMLSFDRLWWTNGIYYRASDTSRSVQAGDNVGHLWIRSVVGLSF